MSIMPLLITVPQSGSGLPWYYLLLAVVLGISFPFVGLWLMSLGGRK